MLVTRVLFHGVSPHQCPGLCDTVYVIRVQGRVFGPDLVQDGVRDGHGPSRDCFVAKLQRCVSATLLLLLLLVVVVSTSLAFKVT